MTVRRRRIATNGIHLDVDEAGSPSDPLVVLLHGFPESSHSWRHQLEPLAEAGHHVIAPNQRGYATSSAPAEVEDYRVDHLCDDVLGVLADTGADDAIVVGHDWGALLLWDLARLHPRRVRAAMAASVPLPPWPAPPTDVFRQQVGDRFFYMLYFQEVGPAERELGADVRATMRRVLWGGSGEMFGQGSVDLPVEDTGFLDTLAAPDDPASLPAWLSSDDLDVYVEQFSTSGFFGPVSWYRNLDANFELLRDLPYDRLSMPTFFIGGERDMVTARRPESIELMESLLPNHQRSVVLDGAGHWMQQERPDAFNEALLGCLATL